VLCPRCDSKLENIVEFFIEEPEFIYTKEYYCTKCKSSMIEHFDNNGFYATEWIDFNV
jgi:hypothetical protein